MTGVLVWFFLALCVVGSGGFVTTVVTIATARDDDELRRGVGWACDFMLLMLGSFAALIALSR